MGDNLEAFAVARPPCHEIACERPVQRVENRWHQDEDGQWRLVATMVCADGHRVIVEPLELVGPVPVSDEVREAGWDCERRGHKYWHPNGVPSSECVECGGSDG